MPEFVQYIYSPAHTLKNGKHYFAIVVRGTSSSTDLFQTDIAAAADGFHITAATIEAQFKLFVKEDCGLDLNSIRNNCKFFVTGHSLGGAVANIIARNLNNDVIGFSMKDIFGYTYASPKTAVVPSFFGNKNIFNLLNLGDGDPVPLLWPTRLCRYGREIPLYNSNTTAFEEQFQRLTGTSYYNSGFDALKPHYVQTYMSILLSNEAIDPETISFLMSYARVACPVDVEIYNADNQLAGSVIGGEVVNNVPENLFIYVEDDVKHIYFQGKGNYTIRMTGTDSGTMDYSIQSIDLCQGEVTEEKEFKQVALTSGKKMVSYVNIADQTETGPVVAEVPLYVLDANDVPEKEVLSDGKGTELPYEPQSAVKFSDVSPNAYYYDPVVWAVGRNITAGTSATTFSPNDTCTQVQILAFLWRAAGEPESAVQLPFALRDGLSYADGALRWALEKEMIDGSFDQSAPCTRASAVNYIWQAFGSPAASGSSFSDVADGADYAKAVGWAVANGVTAGTSATTFTPDRTCNRSKIVSFLYRAYNK